MSEIPYLLDILLFLGRPLQSSLQGYISPSLLLIHYHYYYYHLFIYLFIINRYGWKELTPELVHYGRFPRTVIDAECHAIDQLIAEDDEVWRLQQSMVHA